MHVVSSAPVLQKKTTYTCSKCGVEVSVEGDKIIRPCAHDNEIVYASLTAHARGISSLARGARK